MALTTDSRLSEISFSFLQLPQIPSSIQYVTDEATPVAGSISLKDGIKPTYPASGTGERDRLEILQEIYASDDGFRDANGDSITVTVLDYDYGDTLENVDSYGPYNPFVAGAWDAYLQAKTTSIVLGEETSIERDDDTGRPDITLTAGLKHAKRRPDSDVLLQGLGDWEVESKGDNFNLKLTLPPNSGITSTNATDDPRVASMLHELEELRETGDEIDTDAATLTLSGLGSRRYALDQSDSSETKWTISGVAFGPLGLQISCAHVDETDVHDRDDLSDWLDGAEHIIGTELEVENPPAGGPSEHHELERVIYPDGTFTQMDQGHLTIHGDDGAGFGKYVMVIGDGRSKTYAQLLSNSDGQKIVPMLQGVNAIHFDESEDDDGVCRFPSEISKIVLLPANDKPLVFHNQNATHTFEVKDPNDGNMFTLLPGEQTAVLVTRNINGTGHIRGKLLRRRSLSGSNVGDFADVNYLSSGNWRYIPIPIPTGSEIIGTEKINADAFSHPNGTYSNGDSINTWDMDTPEAVDVHKNGLITIKFRTVIGGGGSGIIPGGHGLSMRVKQGSASYGTENFRLKYESIGANDPQTWLGDFEDEIEEPFRFLFVWAYYSSGATMPTYNIQIDSYSLVADLIHDIEVEYAA